MFDSLDKDIKGPRPLALHLSNSLSLWRDAPSGAARLRASTEGWHPSVAEEAAKLRQLIRQPEDWDRFVATVRQGSGDRSAKMLAGLTAYLNHPYERPVTHTQIARELGNCRLHDYGGSGSPVLLVPSLVNPHYVLDLMPGRSLAVHLKANGFRPFIVEWYVPGDEELAFGTSDYVMKRLIPFLDHVSKVANRPVPVMGYCMGGTLSVALAARAPKQVASLALVAAPWDFDASTPPAGRKYAPAMRRLLERMPAGMPVPIDGVQAFFTSVDPTLSDRKFRKFADMDQGSEAAAFFVALERWANTGAPLPRGVAEDVLIGWYHDNLTRKQGWKVGGRPLRLEEISCPVWIAAPKQDRLVPQGCAYGVGDGLARVERHDPNAGHVGMMVGSRAKSGLWDPLVEWLTRTGSA